MLVLSRKPGETIRIGDDIAITLVGVKGGRVRIGIEAPEHTRALRAELWETTPAQRRTAARERAAVEPDLVVA